MCKWDPYRCGDPIVIFAGKIEFVQCREFTFKEVSDDQMGLREK